VFLYLIQGIFLKNNCCRLIFLWLQYSNSSDLPHFVYPDSECGKSRGAWSFFIKTKKEKHNMKKLFVLPMLCGALLAGCSSEDKSVEVLGQKCEKIETGKNGDYLVKCPVVPELDAIRNAEKNAMFVSVVPSAEVIADVENIYIDVVPAGTFENVNVNCYRVLGANPTVDGEAMYAVEVCEQ